MSSVVGAAPAGARAPEAARRDLALFLVLVAALSAPLHVAIGRTYALADVDGLLLVAPLMWVPAVSSVVVRLVTRQGFGDVAFRRPRIASTYLLLPVVVGVPAYAIGLGLGLVHLDPHPEGQWLAIVVAGLVVNLAVVPGEEIGWRGFMVTRLVDSGLPAPLFLSGLIWGAWHLPLVLWGGLVAEGPAPVASAALMMVLTASFGYLLALLRLTSGSVWPPILLHVVWNVAFQQVYDYGVRGADEGLWLGEAGVLTAVAMTVVALAVHQRQPHDWTT